MARAAGKAGGPSPVPREPQRARWSSAGLAEVFLSYCVTCKNVTDPRVYIQHWYREGQRHAVGPPALYSRYGKVGTGTLRCSSAPSGGQDLSDAERLVRFHARLWGDLICDIHAISRNLGAISRYLLEIWVT